MTTHWTAENIPNLKGKVGIVTGANRGIGYATARALSSKKCAVILACRSEEKGEQARSRIAQDFPQAEVVSMQLDLANLASVREFAETFTKTYEQLDILINNAAIMHVPFGKTVDGFERQFGINHLGHFALTGHVLDHILNTPKARIVNVSSWGHRFGVIDLDNLNGEKHPDPNGAYARSKLANLLFTYELQRRFERFNVDAIAAGTHPGWTATNLPNGWTSSRFRLDWWLINKLNPIIGQTPLMGALPTLYAATAAEARGGGYYGPGSWGGLRGCPKEIQSSDRSYDTELAAELWRVSEQMTQVRYRWPVIANQEMTPA